MGLHPQHTSRSCDQERLKQKSNGNIDSTNFANIYGPHQSDSPMNTTMATTSEATRGYMGGYSFMASTVDDAGTPEETDRDTQKDISGWETLGCFEALEGVATRRPWWSLQRSTMTNGVFNNNQGSVRVLADCGNLSTTSMTSPDESNVLTMYDRKNRATPQAERRCCRYHQRLHRPYRV